jgi:hypothetical protein
MAAWSPNESLDRSALAEIEARLFEAIRTLRRLPDRERGYLQGLRARWPEPLRDFWDEWALAIERGGFEAMRARPPAPSPAAIDRMLPTLHWLSWLDKDERRIVSLRALGVSWWQIASRMGRSERTAQRRHEQGLKMIAARLAMEFAKSPAPGRIQSRA